MGAGAGAAAYLGIIPKALNEETATVATEASTDFDWLPGGVSTSSLQHITPALTGTRPNLIKSLNLEFPKAQLNRPEWK